MRIISDFKDYYDCMQSSDQDKETILVRKSDEFLYKGNLSIPIPRRQNWEEYGIDIIGFCNLLFIRSRDAKGVASICSLEEYNQSINNDRVKRGYWWDRPRHDFKDDVPRDVFGPIFHIYEYRISKTDGQSVWSVEKFPNLRLQFPEIIKILPPQQAYQELTKFLYNSSNQGRPVPEMDNETKIALAGFDTEKSFRNKFPSGPKRKRNK